MENKEQEKSASILHGFKQSSPALPLLTQRVLLILIVGAILGAAIGYFISTRGGIGGLSPSGKQGTTQSVKGVVVGSDDLKTYRDQAEGVLKTGGIDGEGEYHLERPGGSSQNVYLTSSILDLSEFVGKKVKVWGDTQKAQKAGWLMDVGRVEVLQ